MTIAPTVSWPPTFEAPEIGVLAWFYDHAATVVVQVTSAELSLPVATFVTTVLEAEVQRRYVAVGRKATFIHDWRECRTFGADARQVLIDWGRATRAGAAGATIVMSDETGALIRIAAATGVALMRAVGLPIQLTGDVASLVAALEEGRAAEARRAGV